jgi:hypothetical protein
VEHSPDLLNVETQRELRWIADSYEQAQRARLQAGERIRAILQGRDSTSVQNSTTALEVEASPDPDQALRAIRRGVEDGPSEFLARVYRTNACAEEYAQEAMRQSLTRHPTWPWLSEVRGVGPTLACRLLARLDPVRARRPSAFWAYCGLRTVPGTEYACSTCEAVMAFPIGFRVSGVHKRFRGRGRCPGVLAPRRGPEAGVRVAQPRAGRGESAAYDREAKRTCHLICVSFLRCGGPYAEWYRETKATLEASRPGWAPGRIHLTSLRKTEKLFLAHLWIVWREALHLPVTLPNPAVQGTTWPDPWEMIGRGAEERSSAA